MDPVEIEITLLRIRNAIADKEAIIATANMETARNDCWMCDWGSQIRQCNVEIDDLFGKLRNANGT